MRVPFDDRRQAGRALGRLLDGTGLHDPVVLALPRGGVPVAAEVAGALRRPLDVFVVRKIGHPHQPELAIGAIAEGGTMVLDDAMAATIPRADLARVEAAERTELDRRLTRYRQGRGAPHVAGRDVVLVDDGLATGSTALVAAQALRKAGAQRIVVAAPVAAASAVARLQAVADDVVVCAVPPHFRAVGQWYVDFGQVSDQEVTDLLAAHREPPPPPVAHDEVTVVAPGATIAATLVVPPHPRATIVFAHGSGSSRRSRRNRWVADVFAADGFASLLLDLLTPHEAEDRRNVFDIDLLAARVEAGVRWAEARGGPIGLFGASTGAAAALVAAAALGDRISAVVSRGGRPDLAGPHLHEVTSPTLLIVGGADQTVLELNRTALDGLRRCPHLLTVVPGATHLFEEPGALESVAEQASAWFASHLTGGVLDAGDGI